MAANKRWVRREVKIVGDIGCIPLGGWRGKDQYALVDIRDVPLVEKYQWRLSGSSGTTGKDVGYVITDIYPPGSCWKVNGKTKRNRKLHRRVHMHTMLMGKPPVGCVTDHINRNKLDNRRSVNLRFATYSESTYNRTVPKKYNRVAPSVFGRACSPATREKLRESSNRWWAAHRTLLHTGEIDD